MSRSKEILKNYDEEFDVSKAIKSLINTNFSGSDKEQGKASQLMKGLFFSNDPKAKDFIKELDKLTSRMDSTKFFNFKDLKDNG